ncbi:hypothetical protein H6P81_014006 [Aristolochia fimbriata]|uniref:DOG1 domain-containing protein n=1 Tax=Aristolochia fimbriata TaxID=158543 RepID=A0AAV7EG96_ARIFI|nr:hypothetical protein H6P81_014006 [Aristolochia fimbriata]
MAIDLNHNMTNNPPFDAFFRQWLRDQEDYLRQLLRHDGLEPRETENLLSRVLRHYESYYDEKSRFARADALQFFSPPWLTALEKTFLWIGGWKPSLAFRIMNSVGSLSVEQQLWMERSRAETRVREAELAEEQAKIQESLGGPTVLEQARRARQRARDGERREAEEVLEALDLAIRALLEEADLLRVDTVRKIVEILRPPQSVHFLAAATQLHLRIRRKGLQRETGRREQQPR